MRFLLCFVLALLCRAQSDRCAVEGQVFNNATGEPLKKVQILLRAVGSSADVPYGTITDAAGRFAISDVSPGRYMLTAERSGFIRATQNASGAARRGGVVTLAPGQSLKDVVFRMFPQAVITGRVIDEDGDPVSGAQVQALRTGYVQGRRTLVPATSAMTNDIGEYRLSGVEAGRYYVSANYHSAAVVRRTGGEESYAPTYYPGTSDPAAAAPVQIFPGGQMRLDISLTRTRTVRVSGRVANPAAGTGAARNVMVFLMPRDGGARGFNTRNSTMARDGRFEIRGVTPGSYLIAAHWYEESKRFTASQPVDVGNSGLDDVNLTMSPGFDIAGHIKVEGSAQPVLRATQVMLLPANEMLFGSAAGGRTNPDGSFLLTNVAPDHYRVRLVGIPECCYLKSARLGENDMLEAGATLTSGAGSLEVVLGASAGQVDGVVLDRAGQPAPGATVVLVPGERRRERADLFRTAQSDQRGGFFMKGIAPGDYRLYAWSEVEDGAWQDPEFLKPFEKDAEAVSIEENARQAVQLKLLAAEAQ